MHSIASYSTTQHACCVNGSSKCAAAFDFFVQEFYCYFAMHSKACVGGLLGVFWRFMHSLGRHAASLTRLMAKCHDLTVPDALDARMSCRMTPGS